MQTQTVTPNFKDKMKTAMTKEHTVGHVLDLGAKSEAELDKLIADANAAKASKHAGRIKDAREGILSSLSDMGLNLSEVFPEMGGDVSVKAKRARTLHASVKPDAKKVAAKYRNSEGKEWSGRGRPAAWMPTDKTEWKKYEIGA